MKRTYVIIVFLALFLLAGKSLGQDIERINKQWVGNLFNKWSAKDSPGMAVGIIYNNELIFKSGYGAANLEDYKPISSKTIFNIASCSKQFTAYAIHLLAERGELSLEDNIQKYISEIPDFEKEIKIKHLLYHTSGLKDYNGLLAIKGFPGNTGSNEILELVRNQKELNTKVGERFFYSNTGYFLLAEIVERVSGQSFSEWTEENIFKPLGMKSSYFQDENYKPGRNLAFPVGDAGRYDFQAPGATGLYSNVEDLGKWLIKWNSSEIASTMERMLIKGKLDNGKEVFYASGLGILSYKGYKAIGHSGSTNGYNSYMEYYPELKFGVIVLNNIDMNNPETLARKITDRFLLTDNDPGTEGGALSKNDIVQLDPAVYQDYLGVFEVKELGMIFDFSYEDDGFSVEVSDMGKAKLIPQSETLFLVEGAPGSVTFCPGDRMEETTAIVTMGEDDFKAIRSVRTPQKEKINEYMGNYFSEELDCSIKISFLNDKLVAQLDNKEELNLYMINSTKFLSKHPWVTKFVFIEDENNHIVGLKVDSSKALNNYFGKTIVW